MLGLFKKRTDKEKLQVNYQKLMKEAHVLSKTNRKMSDAKIYEANEVLKKLEKLD